MEEKSGLWFLNKQPNEIYRQIITSNVNNTKTEELDKKGVL